jgi:hypothetical protein
MDSEGDNTPPVGVAKRKADTQDQNDSGKDNEEDSQDTVR